jgi:outer membrane receptor for ferrienterochelin and colicins
MNHHVVRQGKRSGFKLSPVAVGLASCLSLFVMDTYAREVPTLDTIVVTGTRTEKRLLDTPVRTEVITQQELQRTNAITLRDAVENIPGIQLREIHGKSGFEVSLQGLSSDQVLVLLNGLPLAASTGSTVDLDQYLIGDIERIEVVKGATSAQYGSSAMGGVINIITKSVKDGLAVSGQVDLGSYGKQNANGKSVSVNNHHEKLQIDASNGEFKGRIAAEQFRTDGFSENPDNYPLRGDISKRQQISVYGAWQPSDQFMGWIDLNYYDESDEQKSLNFVPPFYLQQHKTEDIERQRISAGSQIKLSEKISVDLKALHESYDTQSRQTTDGYLSALRNSEQENNHFTAQMDLAEWYKQKWQFGVDWHEEKLQQSNNGKFEMQGGEVSRDRYELFAQNDIQWNERLNVVAGLRVQDDQDFGSHSAFKLSAKYRLFENQSFLSDLRASFGQGYRVPNLKERFYSFDHSHLGYYVIGNENLKPESSDSYQIGINAVSNNKWNAEVNFFLNDIQDLIQTDYQNSTIVDGITRYTYNNVAKAKTQGVELSAEYHITPDWSVTGGYTYTEAKDKTTGLFITRRPEHIARLGSNFSLNDALSTSLRLRYQSDEYADSANQNQSPDWLTVDTQFDYKFSPRISVFAGIDNIFDEQRDFESSTDFRPIAGRYAYTGLRFNWDTDF